MVDLGGIGNLFKSIPGLNMISNVMDLAQGIMTGDLGKILSSASQLALTYATGGTAALFQQASSIMSTINQLSNVGSAIANPGADYLSQALTGAMGIEAGIGAIAIIGKQMGLDQASIDAAQGAFAESMGDKRTAREEYGEAGMYKKGRGLFGRTDHVDGKERAQANDFLTLIKANASGGTQQPSIADTVAALIAGPNAGPAQLGGAMGLVNNFQGAVNNLAFQLLNSLLNDQRDDVMKGTGGGQQPGGKGAAGAGAAGAAGGGSAGGAASASGNGSVSGSNSILMNIAMALGGVIDEKMKGMDEVATKLGNLEKDNQQGYGQLTAEMTALGQEMKMVQEALNNTLKSIGEAASGLARKQ